MQIIYGLLSLLLVVYLGLCLALFAWQRSLIYFPQPRSIQPPQNTFNFQVPGADLVVTIRPATGSKALLYFGGNAEDVALNLPSLSQAFPGYAIYLLHYRGYGGSTSRPTEADIHTDALALFDRVQKQHPNVLVMGRSLGSGVAVRLASERPAQRLVLITPYDSIQEIAANQFPYVPVRWLMRDKYESVKYAPAIQIPTTLVAASDDDIIPAANTQRLLAAFKPGIATLVVIPQSGHNNISGSPVYLEALVGRP